MCLQKFKVLLSKLMLSSSVFFLRGSDSKMSKEFKNTPRSRRMTEETTNSYSYISIVNTDEHGEA